MFEKKLPNYHGRQHGYGKSFAYVCSEHITLGTMFLPSPKKKIGIRRMLRSEKTTQA